VRQNSFSLTEEEWTAVLNDIQSDDEKVATLENRLESVQESFKSPVRVLSEAQAINPLVQNIAVGNIEYGAGAAETDGEQTIVLLYTDTQQEPLSLSEADGFKLWLQTRLDTQDILLIVSPQPMVEPATTTQPLLDSD
jgi:hypothetical protein